MPDAVRLKLPIPPGVNNLYFNKPGKGRVPTPAYAQWRDDAGWLLKTQPRRQFTGPFRIRLYVPEDARADIDGLLKAPIDLLVTHRITPDDRFAQSVLAERSADVLPGECLLVVEAAS